MDTLRGEAEICAKELELLIPKHERLLNAVREAVLDLPEKGVAFNGSYDSFWLYPSTVRELAGQAPELVELLDEMRNVGLEWEELRAFPTGERQSVSFTVLRDGGFGGSHMCVDLCSPPPELSPSYYMGIIEVTGKWGIYWTVNSMAGR